MFFARRSDGAFLARRRPPHGLLASTVELPGTPWTSEGHRGGLASAAPVAARWRRLPGTVGQVFTHFALTLTVYAAAFEGGAPEGYFWVARDAVGEAGFSNMMRKAVEHALSASNDAARLEFYGKVKASPLVLRARLPRRSLKLARKPSASPWRP